MNLGRENEKIEFKESTSEFDKACKAIVGILNKGGEGIIYFGVKDNGDVIGQIVGKDTLSTLTDRIRNSIRPSIYPTVKKEEYDGKTIISVSFKGTNKPYAYKGAFYIRVEDQTLPIDPLVLRELIQEGNEYNTKWENELTNYSIEDVDENTLENVNFLDLNIVKSILIRKNKAFLFQMAEYLFEKYYGNQIDKTFLNFV